MNMNSGYFSFFGRKPMEVWQITGSNNRNMAGRMQITTTVLISAPRDRRVQMALIISICEYIHTPNVAAKKLIPLIMMDFMEVS